MIGSRDRGALVGILLGGCLVHLTILAGSARCQSDVVFVTNEALPSLDSTFARFDMGSETFNIGIGSSGIFQGITIHQGHVLVADLGLDAIQEFLPDGTHLGAFAAFSNPMYLESDSAGNVYSTPAGSPSTRFTSAGVANQTFAHASLTAAVGIDADALGNVYIASRATGATGLFKFAADGTFLNSISLGSINPSDLAIDEASELLYLADTDDLGDGIKIFDISGATPSLTGSMVTPADAYIEGIHFAAESGNILATDLGVLNNDARGLEYSPGGVLLDEYRPTGAVLAHDITTFVVPEPSALVLLAVGMLGLCLRRRVRVA